MSQLDTAVATTPLYSTTPLYCTTLLLALHGTITAQIEPLEADHPVPLCMGVSSRDLISPRSACQHSTATTALYCCSPQSSCCDYPTPTSPYLYVCIYIYIYICMYVSQVRLPEAGQQHGFQRLEGTYSSPV